MKECHSHIYRQESFQRSLRRSYSVGGGFLLVFLIILARFIDIFVYQNQIENRHASLFSSSSYHQSSVGKSEDSDVLRANIVDRNGVILASSLPILSLYADPSSIINPKDAVEGLQEIFPDLNSTEYLKRLSDQKKRFVWVKRHITPSQAEKILYLGIPGLGFRDELRRYYPLGRLTSHIVGMTNRDYTGISGIENYFDTFLSNGSTSLKLSMDVSFQSLLYRELDTAFKKTRAKGAAGIVADVQSGEIIAMVSLPDFDPNTRHDLNSNTLFNRATQAVFEQGSVFKLMSAAIAIEENIISLESIFDATKPLDVGRFTIRDFYPQNRKLSLSEVIIYSSNIGSALIGQKIGSEIQRDYFFRLGLLSPSTIELKEVGTPLYPSVWRDINTMTISYGYGVAVSPVQLLEAYIPILNGGYRKPLTLIKQIEDIEDSQNLKEGQKGGERIFSEKTSRISRALGRLAVLYGTGKRADVPGFHVGGKTGTAEKVKPYGGGYDKKKVFSTFLSFFPADKPRYIMVISLDEPQGSEETMNHATAGWVVAPIVNSLIEPFAVLSDMLPREKTEDSMVDLQENKTIIHYANNF